MRRFAVGLAVGVLALLVLTQLLLPAFLEERVAGRLTEDGGSADVSLSAFPAVRLLWGDGKRFEARGRGLKFVPGRGEQVFSRLDGFSQVRIEVAGLEVEGVDASRFTLTRLRSGDPYRLSMRGQISGRDAAELLGAEAGGPLGGIAGGIAGSVLPGGGETELPLTVEADLASRGGRAQVVRTNATVAGLPAGPVAELVVGAVVSDL
ncbi:MAG TPA: hypothetical protein VK304_00440 [Thermoleophilaceae bacterium]|nr:hypothetical protein [Thermoleophilaceae bacterium]